MILGLMVVSVSLSHLVLGQVGIAVTSFTQQVAAGETAELSFPVENLSEDETATLRLYLGNWRQTSTGDTVYLPPEETFPGSCAEWIELDRTQIELPPRESTEATFTLSVPLEAEGSYWAVLFVEIQPGPLPEAPETETGVAVGIREVWRQAVQIYQTVPGTEEPDATISSLKAKIDRSSGLVNIDLEFENTGNTILRDVVGSIDLIDQNGETVDTVTIPKFMILPGSGRSFELTSNKKLAPGVYIARAGVDYGDALASAQRAFMVKK